MSIVSSPIRFAVRKLSSAALLGLVALAVCAGPAAAQGKASGTYLKEAFNRVTGNAELTKRLVGYGYNSGTSVMAAWLDAGGKVTMRLYLNAGTEYLFLAGGDQDALDVDLAIKDESGRILVQDVRTDPDAVVAFTPRSSAYYTMEVSLFKSRDSVPCVCVATILKKGGWDVPLRNLDQAAANFVRVLAQADNELQRKSGKRLDLHREKGQWAMFGAVLPQGETTDVFNLTLGSGPRAFFATGDDNARDVDLFLLDNAGKRTIREDTRTDRDASFVHEPGPGMHRLRVRNFQSTGPSLVMMGVFDIVR
jgi:hypothetical protein